MTQQTQGQKQRDRFREEFSREHPEQENDRVQHQQSVDKVEAKRIATRKDPVMDPIPNHEQRRPFAIGPDAGQRPALGLFEIIGTVCQRKVEVSTLNPGGCPECQRQQEETDPP